MFDVCIGNLILLGVLFMNGIITAESPIDNLTTYASEIEHCKAQKSGLEKMCLLRFTGLSRKI